MLPALAHETEGDDQHEDFEEAASGDAAAHRVKGREQPTSDVQRKVHWHSRGHPRPPA